MHVHDPTTVLRPLPKRYCSAAGESHSARALRPKSRDGLALQGYRRILCSSSVRERGESEDANTPGPVGRSCAVQDGCRCTRAPCSTRTSPTLRSVITVQKCEGAKRVPVPSHPRTQVQVQGRSYRNNPSQTLFVPCDVGRKAQVIYQRKAFDITTKGSYLAVISTERPSPIRLGRRLS